MGTFRITTAKSVDPQSRGVQAFPLGTAGWLSSAGGGDNSDAAILAASFTTGGILLCIGQWLENSSFCNKYIRYRFSDSDAIINLDGVQTLNYHSLPAGFTVTSCIITLPGALDSGFALVVGQSQGLDGHKTNSGQINMDTGVQSVQHDWNFSSNGTSSPPSFFGPRSLVFDMSDAPTMTDVLSRLTITVDATATSDVSFPTNEFVLSELLSGFTFGPGITITGTYEIVQFQFQLEDPGKVSDGQEITITSDPNDPEFMDLTEIDEIKIQYKDSNGDVVTASITSFNIQTPNLLTFFITFTGTPPIVEVDMVSNGTQFSGSVRAGLLLTIWFTDGSGIYRFVPDKTNDTVYIQDTDPVEEIDVKIPDPFFKTGFLPDA